MGSGWQEGPGYATPRFALPSVTPMVKRLMIANFAVYALMREGYLITIDGSTGRSLRDLLVRGFGMSPSIWRDWFPLEPVWQVVTYGFLHDIEPMHVLFNMLGLYFFGTMVESTIGGRRFLVHFLAAVAVGGVVFLVAALFSGSVAPVVGASGGVLAMIVAAAVFRPNGMVIMIMFPIPLKYLAGGLVVLDAIHLLLQAADGTTSGTAYTVHLAGAAYGFLAVRRGFVWRDPVAKLQARQAIAAEERRVSDEQRMDALLAKIHKEGLGALSRKEREFLKRASSKR